MSPPFTSYEDAAAHYSRTVGRQTYPTSVYKSKGSASIDEFVRFFTKKPHLREYVLKFYMLKS